MPLRPPLNGARDAITRRRVTLRNGVSLAWEDHSDGKSESGSLHVRLRTKDPRTVRVVRFYGRGADQSAQEDLLRCLACEVDNDLSQRLGADAARLLQQLLRSHGDGLDARAVVPKFSDRLLEPVPILK